MQATEEIPCLPYPPVQFIIPLYPMTHWLTVPYFPMPDPYPVPVPGTIYPVWKSNLDAEFKRIWNLISSGGCWFASIDTEFPGTIYASDKGRLHDPQYNYKMMKKNVNATNIIQLGLTLADLDRNIYTWEFNLSDFDIDHDPHQNKGSVEFLKRQGIDFRRNKEDGIPSQVFAEKLLSSGLVENRSGVELVWVGFQCSYDFGFFTKILTGQKLPDDVEDFRRDVRYYFGPRVYDVRYIMSFFPSLYGGLEKVAETLGIARVAGKSHQAGSDSLLTYLTFIKLMDICRNSGIEKSCRGVLYSLSRI